MSNAKDRLKGLFNITVTPFADDGAIDFRSLAETIDRVVANGYDGILIGGTYGEFAVMTPGERQDLFRHAVDAAADRIPVLLCSAASDPRLAADLTQLAADLGGIPMVTPPFVSETKDDHIVAFFRALAPLAPSGIVIYNAPGIGVTLSPALIERLSDIPGIIGLKQGELEPSTVDAIANRLSGKLRLFCASDLSMLGPLMSGFDGVSSTNSCAFPELIHAIFSAMRSGDARRAIDLNRLWYPYRDLARRYGQPQTVKAAMTLRGWQSGKVRAPLQSLTQAQVELLAPVVQEIAGIRLGP
jgi:4-hydroxy-tetrahydrodipicolinate synthase